MSSLDLIKMSLGNLWRRKLRTLLTVLGVVIGTTSIITTLSLGFGMKEQNKKLLAQMGPVDVISVVSYPIYDPGTDKAVDAKALDDKALTELSKIENVLVTVPLIEVNGVEITSKKYTNFSTIIGVDPEKYSVLDPKVTWGRFLQEGDGDVAVFGGGLSRSWYDRNARNNNIGMGEDKKLVDVEKDPIKFNIGERYNDETEQRTYAKSLKVKVVGELPEEDWETAYNVYIPMDFALKLQKLIKRENDKQKADGMAMGGNQGDRNQSKYSKIIVKVTDLKHMREVNDEIKKLGYNAQSNLQATDALNKSVESTQKILGGIGAVSLLVAAIGIANTMVMSIYERIKEIGIMKVIGASVSDIKKMFLTEAAFIGFFGGIMGVGLSYFVSFIINYLSKKGGNPDEMGGFPGIGGMGMGGEGSISIIPIWLVGAALIFATLIGILSGYYPARKATKLSPLEAIRTQ